MFPFKIFLAKKGKDILKISVSFFFPGSFLGLSLESVAENPSEERSNEELGTNSVSGLKFGDELVSVSAFSIYKCSW
jgi:hypothetical protein